MCARKIYFKLGSRNTMSLRSAVLMQRKEKQPRCKDATGKKGDVKKKVPHTTYSASASLQRGKGFPVASEGRSVKSAMPGQ